MDGKGQDEFYSGSFSKNKYDGYGILFTKSKIYKGEFKNGQILGDGIMNINGDIILG